MAGQALSPRSSNYASRVKPGAQEGMADATTPVRRPSQTDEPTASTDHGPLTCSAASHVLDSSG